MSEHSSDGDLVEVRKAVYRPLRRGNALEDAVARLVQTIRLGVVAPGESLPPERELAASFGVSRDTVREAIRELADTGYLLPRRGRYGGTFVADPLPHPSVSGTVTAEELDDVLGLRRVLESGSARAAASRTLDAATRADLWARHEAALPAGPDEYRRLDTLLHLAIAEAAGIPSLVALVAENRADVNAWLDTFPLMPRNIQHSGEQHESIVSAILAGRPDAAEAAMRDHLAGSEALLRGFLI
ncbi:FadR/GntR family transcriptional regulator [Microbacterium algeriense]|jgi:DNA-binding FadR family transcriptional regulator|uniref:FadR/GntR family transcriptional regulator n=1 Tax=Microbacterium algeriense TaxID=2615184 RepID=UPI0029B9922C|nr:GntR family transcriptional regulator [Microbacterium algeriense]MDX2399615.1 GntR family transcriptional regulator [Microbacterium algeriense]